MAGKALDAVRPGNGSGEPQERASEGCRTIIYARSEGDCTLLRIKNRTPALDHHLISSSNCVI